jgi:hypothetical protein
MGETGDSLFRRGMISSTQAGKLGILKQTTAQPSKMAAFDDKAGRRDQGGRSDKGHRLARTDHIDKKQDMGTPARASGKPSKGGGAGMQSQPVRAAEIDAGDTQQPKFPPGGKVKKRGKLGTPPRARGPIAAQGGQYGGGGKGTQ